MLERRNKMFAVARGRNIRWGTLSILGVAVLVCIVCVSSPLSADDPPVVTRVE